MKMFNIVGCWSEDDEIGALIITYKNKDPVHCFQYNTESFKSHEGYFRLLSDLSRKATLEWFDESMRGVFGTKSAVRNVIMGSQMKNSMPYIFDYIPDHIRDREYIQHVLRKKSQELPGIDYDVHCPDDSLHDCHFSTNIAKYSIHTVIMHLNDQCKWSREMIADWLDELHESGLDLSFNE